MLFTLAALLTLLFPSTFDMHAFEASASFVQIGFSIAPSKIVNIMC